MADITPSVTPAGWATGIGGGFGTGIVLEWAWNGFMVAAGYPTMTAPVAIALAGLGIFLLGGFVWCVHALVSALAFRLRGGDVSGAR